MENREGYETLFTERTNELPEVKSKSTAGQECCGIMCIMCMNESAISLWASHLEDMKQVGRTDIFLEHGNYLTQDSGLADIAMLGTPTEYLYAIIVILFCICNAASILKQDLPLLMKPETKDNIDDRFLITQDIAHWVIGEQVPFLDRLVPACELIGLAVVVIQGAKQLVLSWLVPHLLKDSSKAGFFRWSALSSFYLFTIPYLQTYSAMKLLYFLAPSIIVATAYNTGMTALESFQKGKRAWAAFVIFKFIFTRACFFIVGLDAFIVKYRIVEVYLNSKQSSYGAILCTLIFIFQVLSIVNIKIYTLERLFLFIFAGEDGILSHREIEAMMVWSALFSKHVYDEFGCFKGSIALLAFDDYTFQRLMLDTKKRLTKTKSSLV